MIDRQSTTWGDVCELRYGKGLRGYKDAVGAVPVYGTNGPVGWCDEPLSKIPSVIIGRKGAYRGVHYSNKPFYVIDTAFFVVPTSQLDTKWAYYNLLTVDINGMDSGSAIPSTSRDDFYRLPLNLPPLTEQKAIASVLGALDDKIENNRRMNETLEEMARAIFKSWFVDFDPVHAKAAGNAPAHMDADTAALFPSSFGDDGLPVGWNEGPMSETITLIGGGTPKTKEASYWGGDINWFSVVDAPSTSDVWVIDTQKKITKLGLDNSSAKLLPPKTTIISARGTVGKTALTLREISMNQSCYGVVGAAGYSSYYTYFSVLKMVTELQANAHGSVFDTITTGTFSSVTVTKPPTEISNRFDKLVETLLSKISNNLRENQTLAELRDTLLPKLMSGEIRVADAEREVEAAV